MSQHQPRSPAARTPAGFTLIELLIVIVVIGILVSIALPAYNGQVQRTRRATVQSEMAEITQNLERFQTVNRTYAGFTFPGGDTTKNFPEQGTTFYEIEVDDLSRTAYTITATPQNDQTADACGTLTLDQAGTRGSGGDVANCW